MMKTYSLRLLAALALACSGLTSCNINGGGPADVVNPTVSQQDDLDVRWGLPKRVSKSSTRSSRSEGGSSTASSSRQSSNNASTTESSSSNTAAPVSTGAVPEEVKSKLR